MSPIDVVLVDDSDHRPDVNGSTVVIRDNSFTGITGKYVTNAYAHGRQRLGQLVGTTTITATSITGPVDFTPSPDQRPRTRTPIPRTGSRARLHVLKAACLGRPAGHRGSDPGRHRHHRRRMARSMSRPAPTRRPRPAAAPMARIPDRTSSACSSRPRKPGITVQGVTRRGRGHHRPQRHAGAHHHQRDQQLRLLGHLRRRRRRDDQGPRDRHQRSQQQQDHRSHRGRLLVPRQLPQRQRGSRSTSGTSATDRRHPASPPITSTATSSRRTTASPSPMARATGILPTSPTGRSRNNEFVGAPIDSGTSASAAQGGQPWYVYPVGGATITGNDFGPADINIRATDDLRRVRVRLDRLAHRQHVRPPRVGRGRRPPATCRPSQLHRHL